ncbi:sensor histidine kinase [Nocardiopsis composta]|uniref:histidine kinase n=1 Tax=Nocardiopsis composta TaxID=157465 RepID=A0A7W8QLM4_9ACTN|nr:HAMP domain-containing sensor histidine kinase [Nocardiopsis composta]MBB5432269.1 two-component system OmpR family sensor kinase [Nocardiopsis composta]
MRRPRLRPRSLAARLTAGVLCLTAAALLAFGAAGAVLLHRSLVDDVDARLHGLAGGPPPGGDRGGDASAEDRPQPPPLPTDLRELSVDADGAVRWSVGQTEDDASGPDVSALDPAGLERAGDAPFTLPDSAGGADWRVVSSARPDGSYRLVAQSLAGVERTLERLVLIEAALGALLLAALGAGAAGLVRLQLRPLRRIERTAAAIAGGDLGERVPDADPATETGRLGAALNTMLAELAASLQERTAAAERMRRFAADASHELRTPLASVHGFAELYRQSRAAGKVAGDPAVDQWMSRIEAQADRMSSLVDDLMLLSRFDSAPDLVRVPLDLRDVAEEAVLDARARAPGTPVELDAPVPVPFTGDGDRLRRILANLLANALVHPPEGTPVRVSVGRTAAPPRPGPGAAGGPGEAGEEKGGEPEGSAGKRGEAGEAGPREEAEPEFAVVSVHDDGPGIPAADVPRVFDRFHRVEESRSRDRGGSGLGLAITAALAAAHGGYIHLDTGRGKGTTFTVVLPLP